MFADPQVITVNSVAKSMPRIDSDGTTAIYQTADEAFKMTISHQRSAKRIRTVVRVDQRVVAADPLTSVNAYQTLTDYHVIDRPLTGFTSTQVAQQVAALNAWLDSTAIGKLYGQES